MEITEELLDTYQNVTVAVPDIGDRIEALCFLFGGGFPYYTYSIYRGIVQGNDNHIIVLNIEGATRIDVAEGEADNIPVEVTLNDRLQLPYAAGQNIYWKSLTVFPTGTLPKGKPPKNYAAEDVRPAAEGVRHIKPRKLFGGTKKRKSRKTRKSRRKK